MRIIERLYARRFRIAGIFKIPLLSALFILMSFGKVNAFDDWPGCYINAYHNGYCQPLSSDWCENLPSCPAQIVVEAYYNWRCENATSGNGVSCVTRWNDCYRVQGCGKHLVGGELVCYTIPGVTGWIEKNVTVRLDCAVGTG
jgi:hypothetical protein